MAKQCLRCYFLEPYPCHNKGIDVYKIPNVWVSFNNRKNPYKYLDLYSKEELLHKQVSAIVNFKPRQIANFLSECLILGIYDKDGHVVLLQTSQPIKNGEQIR